MNLDLRFLQNMYKLKKKKEKGTELKIYSSFILKEDFKFPISGFKIEKGGGLIKSDQNLIFIDDVEAYYLKKDSFLHIATLEKTERSGIIEKYIETHPFLGQIYVEGFTFRKYIQDYIKERGIINEYSARFNPYNEYTGYGLTIKIWGKRSDEILDKIKRDYKITPIGLKANILEEDKPVLSFRAYNNGKVSYIRGNIELFYSFIKYYNSVVLEVNKNYTYRPMKERRIYDTKVLELHDECIFNFMDNRGEERKELDESEIAAFVDLLTKGGIKYGWVGYRVGKNKADILDLKKNKRLFITIKPEAMEVIAKNPSDTTESIKRLYKTIVENLYPYTTIRIKPLRVE